MRHLHGVFSGIFLTHYKRALYADAAAPCPLCCAKVAHRSAIFAVWRAVFAGQMAIFSHRRAKIVVRRAIFAHGWAKFADGCAIIALRRTIFAVGRAKREGRFAASKEGCPCRSGILGMLNLSEVPRDREPSLTTEFTENRSRSDERQ